MSVQFCCLAGSLGEVVPVAPTLLHYMPRLAAIPHAVSQAQVVLGAESESTVDALLNAGAHRVFVGEAALLDAELVPRLLQRFGAARIGLHVAVRRQSVSWSFETESNADFRVITPSLCEPAWEVLKVDGEGSGVRAKAWLGAMVQGGVQSVLLRADLVDDADLNLCADMVETLGDKLWLAPLHDAAPAIADWVRYGQATQIGLPSALYHRRHELLRSADGASTRGPLPQGAFT